MTPFDMQPTLTGSLLTVRPLRESDRAALFATASDPLIWDQHPAKRHRPEVFGEYFRESIDSGGALIVHDATTGEVIGSSRYFRYDEAASEIEIGWTFLARSHWGGAWNGELKRLMLEHAFRFVDSVFFIVAPENLRSQRAVEKIGGVREPERDEPGQLFFRLRRDDWAGRGRR